MQLHAPELNRPLNSYEYEPARFRGRDQEALSAAAKSFPGGIEARACPSGLHDVVRAVEESTGLSVRFFSGKGSPETGGFLSPSHPQFVFLNTESDGLIGNLIAHEWAHGLKKDPVKAGMLAAATEKIFALMAPGKKSSALQAISGRYDESKLLDELSGNIIADAICLHSQWGSEQLFDDWKAVQEIARMLWNEANPVAPSALQDAADADLSRGAESFSLPPASLMGRLAGEIAARQRADSGRDVEGR